MYVNALKVKIHKGKGKTRQGAGLSSPVIVEAFTTKASVY